MHATESGVRGLGRAFAGLVFMSVLWTGMCLGESAIGQLEGMTGQKIDRLNLSGGGMPSFQDQMAMGLAQGLVEGLVNGLFNNNNNAAAAQQAEMQRQIQELERVRAEELKRQRIQRASDARSRWDAESEKDRQKRRSLLGEPDTNIDDIADILGPDVVDLRDAKTLTPKLLREPENVGQPIFEPAPTAKVNVETPVAAPVNSGLDRFSTMVAENRDPEKLNSILVDLRSQLSKETNNMRRLLAGQQLSVKEIQDAEAEIQQAVNNAKERGISMASDWWIDMSTDKLGVALQKAGEQVADGTRTLASTQAAAITYAGGKAIGPTLDTAEALTAPAIGDKLAAAYNVAEASGFFDGVGDKVLGRYKDYLKYGKSIVESAADVTTELTNMQRIGQQTENLGRYQEAFGKMDGRMKGLVEKIHITEEQLKAVGGTAGAP